MHSAAFRGHTDVAELLLANGADVNAENAHEWTPLHAAADAGYEGLVKVLLANGADVNAENNARSKPLYLAVVGATRPWQNYCASTVAAKRG